MSDSKAVIYGLVVGSVLAAGVVGALLLLGSSDETTASQGQDQVVAAVEPQVGSNAVVQQSVTSSTIGEVSEAATSNVFDVDALHDLEEEISSGVVEPERQIAEIDALIEQIDTSIQISGALEIKTSLVELRQVLTDLQTGGDPNAAVQAAQSAHGSAHSSGHNHG